MKRESIYKYVRRIKGKTTMKTKNIQDVVAERVEEFHKKMENTYYYTDSVTKMDMATWLTTTLTQLVKEVEAGAYQRGYEQGKFDGTMDTLHPTHAMHEPNLQAKHTGDNLTPPTSDVIES